MPILNIKSNKLNFEIVESLDPKVLSFLDTSTYLEKSPDKPLVEVLVPGYSKSVIVPYKVNRFNTLSAGQLNITCGTNDNMPDGVYQLTIRVCPYEVVFCTKYYLKTDLLQYEIDDILLNILYKQELSDSIKKSINTMFVLLESAKVHARNGNIEEATEMYKKIQKLVTKIKC
jgi:hypothetical protein